MNIYSITATTYKLIFTIDSIGYEKPICKIDSISNGFATCANQITIKLWSEAPYKAAPELIPTNKPSFLAISLPYS